MEPEAYQTISAIHQTDWWYRGRETILLAALRRLRHRTGRAHERWSILDVGCGFGALTSALAEFGSPCGLDKAPECIGIARQRYPSIAFEEAAIPDQLPHGTFDLIVLADVLEHLDEREAVLSNLKKRLKPRGWLLITVPAGPSLWTGRDEVAQHRLRYRPRELCAELDRSGLRPILMTHFNTLLFLPIWLFSQVERRFHIRLERIAQRAERRGEVLFAASPLMNHLLLAIFRLEEPLVGRIRCRVGVSLLAVAEKES